MTPPPAISSDRQRTLSAVLIVVGLATIGLAVWLVAQLLGGEDLNNLSSAIVALAVTNVLMLGVLVLIALSKRRRP